MVLALKPGGSPAAVSSQTFSITIPAQMFAKSVIGGEDAASPTDPALFIDQRDARKILSDL